MACTFRQNTIVIAQVQLSSSEFLEQAIPDGNFDEIPASQAASMLSYAMNSPNVEDKQAIVDAIGKTALNKPVPENASPQEKAQAVGVLKQYMAAQTTIPQDPENFLDSAQQTWGLNEAENGSS